MGRAAHTPGATRRRTHRLALLWLAVGIAIPALPVGEFFDAGNGTLAGPQGGTFPPPATTPTSVNLGVVVGSDPAPPWDYLSLPTDSFVTVGFGGHGIIDGPGGDVFVTEVGSAGEVGDIFVSGAHSTDPIDLATPRVPWPA